MNSSEYIGWILEQPKENYTVERDNEDHLILESEKAAGEVTVYHLDMDVIELRLYSKSDHENFFFLHFELKDDEHARGLYREMTDSLVSYGNRKTLKILLSCTSGMTTSFFAQKLNEASGTLSLDYEFNAVPLIELYHAGFDYDVILLAPQIAWQHKKAEEIFEDRMVLNIPAAIFGTYDAGKMIDEIRRRIHLKKEKEKETKTAAIMRDIDSNAVIFVINMTNELNETRYIQRLYEAGKPLFTEEIIKKKSSLYDIRDILDTQLRGIRKNFRVDCAAISVPGMTADENGMHRTDYSGLAETLSSEYGLPVYVCHNTSAVAYGYYASQNRYDIITYHSQPAGALIGGQGSVYKGMLIDGKNHMGGELRGLFRILYPEFRDDPGTGDTEKTMEALTAFLAANICELAPEVILVRSALTPDMDELRSRLEKLVEKNQIPDLIHVRDISEYAYLGTMLYGMHELKKAAAKTAGS